MTKQTVGNVLCAISGAVTVLLIYFWIFHEPPKPPPPADIPAEWLEYQHQAQHWQRVAGTLADSLAALETEKGRVEIELNRSQAKIQEYIRQIQRFQQYPVTGTSTVWTEEIDGKVKACDSLAGELKGAYSELQAQRGRILDSLNIFYGYLIEAKDSALIDQERYCSKLLTDLTVCRYDKARQGEELTRANKSKRKGWLAAAVAGAAAILTNINF